MNTNNANTPKANTAVQQPASKIFSLHFVILVMLSLIVLASASFVHAASYVGPSLNATLLYYEPVPAEPGSVLDVFVQIENGGESARKVRVEFIDNYPFTLDNEEQRIQTIENIPGAQNFLIKYKVRVDKDAPSGTSYVKVQWSQGTTSNLQSANLPISIQAGTVALDISQVRLEPEIFMPGAVGKITLSITNGIGLKITSGTLKLDLASLDIAPIGSTNQERFTDLQSGDTRQIQFQLAPSPSITPGIYKIPVILSFKDQQGNNYNTTAYVGIQIGVDPELLVYIDQSAIDKKTKEGTVLIKFVNKGLSEIQFLDFEAGGSSGVEVLSESTRVYVGNIDKDDYETAELMVKLQNDKGELPLKIAYRDALNRPYEKSLTLKVATTAESAPTTSSSYLWIVAVVAVIGGVWWFMRRKK